MTDTILSFISDGPSGNSVDFIWLNGGLEIELDQPWYGDSETGFGATLTHQLLKQKDIEELRDWLTEILKDMTSD